jgi:hypothetical protein
VGVSSDGNALASGTEGTKSFFDGLGGVPSPTSLSELQAWGENEIASAAGSQTSSWHQSWKDPETVNLRLTSNPRGLLSSPIIRYPLFLLAYTC